MAKRQKYSLQLHLDGMSFYLCIKSYLKTIKIQRQFNSLQINIKVTNNSSTFAPLIR
jgi:hypothetical protein